MPFVATSIFFDELLSTDLTLDFLDPLGVAMASSIPVFETPPGHYSGTACIAMNEDGTYVIIFEDQGTMKGRRCVVADPPDLSISATDADKPEGDSGTTPFTFTVTRSGDTSGTTMVDFAVTGTGDDPVNAADFGGTLPSGMITFNDGETSKPVTVDVSGDTINEAIETFDVGLSNPSGGATISNGAARHNSERRSSDQHHRQHAKRHCRSERQRQLVTRGDHPGQHQWPGRADRHHAAGGHAYF